MSAKKSQNVLPKTLFIYKEEEKDGSEFFICNEDYENTAQFGEIHTVGVYKLEKVVRVSAVAKVEEL